MTSPQDDPRQRPGIFTNAFNTVRNIGSDFNQNFNRLLQSELLFGDPNITQAAVPDPRRIGTGVLNTLRGLLPGGQRANALRTLEQQAIKNAQFARSSKAINQTGRALKTLGGAPLTTTQKALRGALGLGALGTTAAVVGPSTSERENVLQQLQGLQSGESLIPRRQQPEPTEVQQPIDPSDPDAIQKAKLQAAEQTGIDPKKPGTIQQILQKFAAPSNAIEERNANIVKETTGIDFEQLRNSKGLTLMDTLLDRGQDVQQERLKGRELISEDIRQLQQKLKSNDGLSGGEMAIFGIAAAIPFIAQLLGAKNVQPGRALQAIGAGVTGLEQMRSENAVRTRRSYGISAATI